MPFRSIIKRHKHQINSTSWEISTINQPRNLFSRGVSRCSSADVAFLITIFRPYIIFTFIILINDLLRAGLKQCSKNSGEQLHHREKWKGILPLFAWSRCSAVFRDIELIPSRFISFYRSRRKSWKAKGFKMITINSGIRRAIKTTFILKRLPQTLRSRYLCPNILHRAKQASVTININIFVLLVFEKWPSTASMTKVWSYLEKFRNVNDTQGK